MPIVANTIIIKSKMNLNKETVSSSEATVDSKNINKKESYYYIDTDGNKRPVIKPSDFMIKMMGIKLHKETL